SLWRVPLPHFSIWDHNFPFGFPLDAIAPILRETLGALALQEKDQGCQSHSVIRCEEQSLGESVAISGTPFRLHYQSDRAVGRREFYQLPIPLSGATVPASLTRIDLEVFVAGQSFTQSFPPTPNQTFTVTWDGRDGYGRPVQGRQPARIRLGYVYGVVYTEPAPFIQSFLAFSATGAAISTNAARFERTLWQESSASLGAWDTQAVGLGGWSLSGHHGYDVVGKTLFLGDGGRRSAEGLGSRITTVAGNGLAGFVGDGGPATGTPLFFPSGVAVAPDGSLFLVDQGSCRVRKVNPDGIITTVAGQGIGGGLGCGHTGDGGPAVAAQLNNLEGITVGPDGSLYLTVGAVVVNGSAHVRRVSPDGIITTVAGGTGGSCFG
ncbi:MAG: RHS repeat-associated core domain-containing protein, partial [Candidatus Methylomirabilales bacterium]